MPSLLKLSDIRERIDSVLPQLREYDPLEVVPVMQSGAVVGAMIALALGKRMGVYYPSGSGYPVARLMLEGMETGRLLVVMEGYDETILKELHNTLSRFEGIDYRILMVMKSETCPHVFHYELFQGEVETLPWK